MITVSPTFSFRNEGKAVRFAFWLMNRGYDEQADKILAAVKHQRPSQYNEGGPVPAFEPAPEPAGPIDCDHRVFMVRRISGYTDRTYVGTTELKGKEKQLAELLNVGDRVKLDDGVNVDITIARSK